MSRLTVLLLVCLAGAASRAGADQLERLGDRLSALEDAVADLAALQRSQGDLLRRLTGLTLGERQAAALGAACTDTLDCRLTDGAVCSGGVCGCPAGTWNFSNSTCRPAAAEGEPCRLSGDCTATSPTLTCSGRPRRCAERVCFPAVAGGYRYRLVGGASCDEGRVQAVGPDWGGDDFEWWQVCADSWGPQEARVLCRSLDRGGGEVVRADAVSRQRVWKVSLNCAGSESALQECVSRLGRPRIGISDCRQGSVAAVRCEPRTPLF
ncbi:Antigen WC1.1 [Amphibalanus amphitrite]|uniref:Antigen WC1.1 n=1 Tax=Amphibalanus amphitrite TaxID=1232801 RepID=A0A6A4VNT2_AMPAM|nr:Antigen WC1.1 [Amphibalanus amphitrite]